MGHYVADLAQPLHVTENHDGQMTEQKGLHHYFEEEIIDQLYPELHSPVFAEARKKWAAFHKENKNKTPFDLARELGKLSAAKIDTLLKIDKQLTRKSPNEEAAVYKDLAIDRLSTGVLYLAEIWSRQVGWKYDGHRFYNFAPAPKYIDPQSEK